MTRTTLVVPASMRLRILVDSTPTATRAAVLEDSELVEIHVETRGERSLVGNIYKGRVSNVAPGMQAAFVDVGLEHDVFLPVSGVARPPADGESESAGSPGGSGADERSEASPSAGCPGRPKGEMWQDVPADARIQDLLSVGQEIEVQVVKEPVGAKGARGTTHLTLPGRYLVLMPTCNHLGISRRIVDPQERDRLKALVEPIRPAGTGLIIRTVAAGVGPEELAADVEFLKRRWALVREQAARATPHTVVYEESCLLDKVVRDLFSPAVESLTVERPGDHERLVETCRFLSPALTDRIRLHEGAAGLFESHGVEKAMERALERRVWLKSGGTVVIEETEALHSIDVNTGRFLGSDNLEETAFKTNLEAAGVIARQVRLRNLAGIIVVDFIDMIDDEHKQRVMDKLRECFRNDRARTNILDFTPLGLVQMTRQRSRGTLSSRVKEPCPYCRGEGEIMALGYLLGRIVSDVERLAKSSPAEQIAVVAHPTIARHLLDDMASELQGIEAARAKRIVVCGDGEFHRSQYTVGEGV